VLGHDVVTDADAVRSLVSLTGQLASVDEDLSGEENLVLLARLLGFGRAGSRARADQLLHAFDLAEAGGRQVKHYSGGMRRRLDIAASLVVTPRLLFLDEPTTGLDPRSRNQVWEIVRALVAQGTSVLLCTQYLDEADQLADRIAVIDHGRSSPRAPRASSRRRSGRGALHVACSTPSSARTPSGSSSRCSAPSRTARPTPPRLSASAPDADRAADAVAELARAGVALADFSLGQPSLDEVFLALTGRAGRAPRRRHRDHEEVTA
jgi:ABC-2 type transport system ATP-binding protein